MRNVSLNSWRQPLHYGWVLMLLVVLPTISYAQDTGRWIDPFPGVAPPNDIIRAFAFADNGDIYVAGDFTEIGGQVVNHVARWNGTEWEALGTGVNDWVFAMTLWGEDLYIGGRFVRSGDGQTELEYLARWNGSAWESVGDVSWIVQALLVADNNLYVGGRFTRINELQVSGIARWDGVAWHALANGLQINQGEAGNLPVLALAHDGTDLYAGGIFTETGGDPNTTDVTTVNRIARWDGATWHSLANGVNGTVRSLAYDSDGILYAGGNLTRASGIPTRLAAQWDGATWQPLGQDLLNQIGSVALIRGDLYAGGSLLLERPDGSHDHIARWNGASWESLGAGLNGSVWGLAAQGDSLWVSGFFTEAGNQPISRIAVWYPGTPVSNEEGLHPTQHGTHLQSIYPNPFGASSTITYAVQRPARVRISIHDVLGREITVLADHVQLAGTHLLQWQPTHSVPGVYVVRLESTIGVSTALVTHTR